MKTINIPQFGEYIIDIGEYLSNRNTSVVLRSTYAPDYIKLSTNTHIILPAHKFAVKNYSENAIIIDAVFDSKLFIDTGETISLPNNLVVPIWELSASLIESALKEHAK